MKWFVQFLPCILLIFNVVSAISGHDMLDANHQIAIEPMQVSFAESLTEMLSILDDFGSLNSIEHIKQLVAMSFDGSDSLIIYAYDYLASVSLQSYSLKRLLMREIFQQNEYGYTSMEAFTLLIDLSHLQHDSSKLRMIDRLLQDFHFVRAIAETIHLTHIDTSLIHHNLMHYDAQVSAYFNSFDGWSKQKRATALISMLCQLGLEFKDEDGLSTLSDQDSVYWNRIKEFMTSKLVSVLTIESSDPYYKQSVLDFFFQNVQRMRPVYDSVNRNVASDIFSNDFFNQMMTQVYELSDRFGLLDLGIDEEEEEEEDADLLTSGFVEVYGIYQYIKSLGRQSLPEWDSFVILRSDPYLVLLMMDHLISALDLDTAGFYRRAPLTSKMMARHLSKTIVIPMARLIDPSMESLSFFVIGYMLEGDLLTRRVGLFLSRVFSSGKSAMRVLSHV